MRKFFLKQLQKLPRQPRALLLTCLFGLGAGGVSVLFHYAIGEVFQSTYGRLKSLDAGTFIVGSLVVILASSLAVGYLLHSFSKAASGSGVPQLKLAFWKEFGFIPWRVVWVKFVAGAISIGGGCSLGREGPSVQIAAGLASNIAGGLGEAKQSRRVAAAAGAAAGLAAAFNTPLAAITFVLEEIVTDLNSSFLGGVLLASVLGAFVSHAFLGPQPAFTLENVGVSSWPVYLLVPVVAAIASLVGVFFQKSTLKLRARRKGFERIPDWCRPVLGGLITWVLGCAVFLGTGHLGVFGLGYGDLSDGLTNHLTWKIAGILLAAKLVATIACYGFGGCGGIFSPTLFFGGMCGLFLTGALGTVYPFQPHEYTLLAVVGMSACLGAVVRAPITSILIVFEMTHEFDLVPPLMVTALISHAISRKFTKQNFYEALLTQDGHNVEHLVPPRDLNTWQQLPVSAIANFQPVVLDSLKPEELKRTLKTHPYQCFPYTAGGGQWHFLRRQEIELALAENREPRLEHSVSCRPGISVRRLQHLLIESPTGVVLVMDAEGEKLLGLITLHDLLRAEVAMAEAHKSGL